MRALLAARGERARLTEVAAGGSDELAAGGLVVDVEFSGVNYKDALALSGDPGVLRASPLVAGIDLAGTVAHGAAGFAPGDRVVVTGAGHGESIDGGLAERARVRADSVVRVPDGMTTRQAAAIGTAGVTAALAVLALERHGIPDGPILVTGASGGVGSIAILLLAAAGREVDALTGSPERAGALRGLGATGVVDRAELAEPGRPLQSARWAGVVDAAGGTILANALARLVPGGAAAACGLVADAALPTTVLPFILRGAALLGIDSVHLAPAARAGAWERLGRDFDLAALDALTREVDLAGALEVGDELLAGRGRGRVVVDVRR